MAAALSSSRRALHTLHRRILLLHHTPSPAAARFSPPTPAPFPIPRHSPNPTPSSSRFFSTARPDARLGHRLLRPLPQRLVGGVRSASTGGRSKLPPLGQGVKVLGRPVEAFWRRNYMILVGAGRMAKYAFLALVLATPIVAIAGMYAEPRWTINPDEVYQIAMTKLNTSAAVLEVMGAPLTVTYAGAFVRYGGGPFKPKGCKFRFGGTRCFFIFTIKGSERNALVSGEVKKIKEQYEMKVLAVDIPMASGPDQRLFLIGDEQEYEVGGALISEVEAQS